MSGVHALARGPALLSVVGAVLLGLAGCGDDEGPIPPTENHTPVIDSVTVSADTVLELGTVSLTLHATDPDGDALSYWFLILSGGGSITVDGNTAEWIAPNTPGNARILVSAVDEHDAVASRALTLVVIDAPTGISGTIALLDPAGEIDLVGARVALYTSEAAWTNNNPWYTELIEAGTPITYNFVLEPVPVGTYYLDVWKDVNENGERDAADLFGFHGTGSLSDPELLPVVVNENEVTRIGTLYAS